MARRAGLISRVAGIERLEERFDQQDALSKERHLANKETLAEIKQTTAATDVRVTKVEKRVSTIEDRSEVLTEHKLRMLSWRQGIVLSLISGGAVWLVHISGVL